MNADEIIRKLDELVEGQSEAKRLLAFLAIMAQANSDKWDEADFNGRLPVAPVGILTGRTGTGKTHLCRSLAAALSTDFLSIDCSSLPAPPWHGCETEGIKPKLLDAFKDAGFESNYIADGTKSAPIFRPGTYLNEGVILLDEIDKSVSQHSPNSRDFKQDAAASLLDVFNDWSNVYGYDIRGCVIIFAGSFEMAGAYENKRGIGFNAGEEKAQALTREADKMSMPRELLYRIPHHAHLNVLTKEQMLKILDTQYIDAYRHYTVDCINRPLCIPQETKEKIVEAAMKTQGGARGLHTELSKYIIDEFLGPNAREQEAQDSKSEIQGRKL